MSDEDDNSEAEYFSGEKGRRIPRVALIMLGIALIVLLLFVFARPSWFTRDVGDESLHVPAERHFLKSIASSGKGDGVWLNDESPSSSFLVTFPTDSAREQTRVHLKGTSTVGDDAVGFLTVKMDGQQVFTQELPRGENGLDQYIDVPDELAADGRVRIQMRLDGDLANERCTDDRTTGTQVHLDSDSIVEAALDEPVHTVRDAVVSWDRAVTIVLPDQSDEWKSTAAQLGIALTQAGHDVAFADSMPESDSVNTIAVGPTDKLQSLGWTPPDGASGSLVVGAVDTTPVLGVVEPDGTTLSPFLTTSPVTAADAPSTDPRSVPTPTPSVDEVGLGSLGADMTVTEVTDNQSWRVRYSLTELPGGRLPQALRVALQLPAAPDDLAWVLSVQLNGQMLASRKLTQDRGDTVIGLPASAQLMDNDLRISVVRDRNIGGCDVRVTPYPMQLLPASALQIGKTPGTGFTALPAALTAGSTVYTSTRARDPIAELAAIVPVLAVFVAPNQVAEFRWNTQPVPGRSFIVVGDTPSVDTPVRMRDGRIVAGVRSGGLDISSFTNGLIVQTAANGDGRGLSIQYVGDTSGVALPAFGSEDAEVITRQGSFTVLPDGTTVPSDQMGGGQPR